ncbi:MAG: DUF3794 domain-containing protein, partial [Clostridiales bacterium]|nr:DUF3794 domain-containing protein [Clostridiales bacterium]
AGKASIGEILRTDVRILGRESKAAGNKVLIKGDVCVSTLYLADSDESVHCMEHQLPFSEIISIDEEAGDGAEIVPEYHVLNLSWNPQQDMDGDRRLLGADVNIRAILRLEQNISAEVLNDVYSTRKNLDVVRDSVNVTSAVAKTAGTVIASDIVTIDEGAPEIQQIYNVIANTKIANARCEGGKIAVEGLVDAEVLYLSNSADTPICSVHKEIRFMQTLDTIGSAAGSDAICDVQADLSHLSYTLNLAGEVELRATIALDVQALEQKEYQYVVNIEEREDEAPDRHQPYCLRVYFVREGDTAWNIAKRYKINLNDFTARNGTELAVGQRLILQG